MRLILFFTLLCLFSGQVAQGQETVGDCPGAPPSRLVIGQHGLILSAHPGDLHAEPRLSSEIVETIPSNSVFDVLDGPTCADDFAWWHVRYGDQDGWMIEAEDDRYFLEPLTPITAANVQQLDDYQLLGRGVFTTGVEWSSDGERIAVGSTVGIVQFNTADLSAPSTWYDPGNVCDVEYSDDGSGRWGFAICDDDSTEIRTIDENPYAEHWYSYNAEIHAFEFIKNRDTLAIATDNKLVAIGGGYEDVIWEGENRIVALDVSPDGLVLAATDGHQVVLGTPFSQLDTALLDVGGAEVTSLALNFDGTLLAVGVDRQIQLWDVETKTLLASHDNLGGVDRPYCISDAPFHVIIRSVDFDESPAVKALDMKFSGNGYRLVTATDGGTLTVWDVRGIGSDADIQQTYMIDSSDCVPLTHLALNPSGTRAAFISVSSPNNTLSVWDINRQELVTTTTNGHTAAINDIAFKPNTTTLASVGVDGTVRLWDFVSGLETALLKQPGAGGSAVAFSPDGDFFAALYQEKVSGAAFQLWDAHTNNPSMSWAVDFYKNGTALAFSPDSHFLATDYPSIQGQSVKIWKIYYSPPWPLSGPPNFYIPLSTSWSQLAFSPDGRWFVYTDMDGQKNGIVRILDTVTYTPIHTLKEHTNPIWDVAFSPDSKLLVSVSGTSGPGALYLTPNEDNTARVWDVQTGVEKFALQHDSSVNSVAFSPDGTFFVTGTEKGDINFWDAATGENLRTIHVHYGSVNSLAFSPDGVWLAASTGSVVKIYRIPAIYPFGEG